MPTIKPHASAISFAHLKLHFSNILVIFVTLYRTSILCLHELKFDLNCKLLSVTFSLHFPYHISFVIYFP